MLRHIDSFLNSITMYQVVLRSLVTLALITLVMGATGILFFPFSDQITSLLLLFVSCYGSNWLFAKLFKAPTNVESSTLTALILFFLLIPVADMKDAQTAIVAGMIAMASKYFFAWNEKHLFNPAAFVAFALGLLGNGNVIWWVGSDLLLPFVAILGLLIVRKIRRFSLFLSFLGSSLITIMLFSLKNGVPAATGLVEAFTSWPLIFFGTVMLTEPLTMPPTKKLQMAYGLLVGVLFGSQFEFGPIYSTPELALLLGNVFSFAVSPRLKLFLTLKERTEVATDTYEFIFKPSELYTFKPGQYLEWTFPHKHPDSRGNRRYFTIASSPTENILRLVVRIEEEASSYKRHLLQMRTGESIVASQLAGDFVLPENNDEKLVLIAGGIGVTPFISMITYLIDKKEKRPLTFLYVNSREPDIAFKELFNKAEKELGIKVHYVLTKTEDLPQKWSGLQGRINAEMLTTCLGDCTAYNFYLSGPNAMVDSTKDILLNMNVNRSKIKTDYFPGF